MKNVFFLILYGGGAFCFGYFSDPIAEIISIVALLIGGLAIARFIGRHSKN